MNKENDKLHIIEIKKQQQNKTIPAEYLTNIINSFIRDLNGFVDLINSVSGGKYEKNGKGR
ncbi:MAG: hypothetical protein GYA62_04155 [Bacteroidales bacterium]|nr:hypothetical protein [Bacteroidales bacterium]